MIEMFFLLWYNEDSIYLRRTFRRIVSMNKRIACFDCARSLCMLFIVAYWHIYAHFSTPVQIPVPWGGSISRGVLASFFLYPPIFWEESPSPR